MNKQAWSLLSFTHSLSCLSEPLISILQSPEMNPSKKHIWSYYSSQYPSVSCQWVLQKNVNSPSSWEPFQDKPELYDLIWCLPITLSSPFMALTYPLCPTCVKNVHYTYPNMTWSLIYATAWTSASDFPRCIRLDNSQLYYHSDTTYYPPTSACYF